MTTSKIILKTMDIPYREKALAKALVKCYGMSLEERCGRVWVNCTIGETHTYTRSIPFYDFNNVLFDKKDDLWCSLNYFVAKEHLCNNIINYSSLDELEVKLALAGFPIE